MTMRAVDVQVRPRSRRQIDRSIVWIDEPRKTAGVGTSFPQICMREQNLQLPQSIDLIASHTVVLMLTMELQRVKSERVVRPGVVALQALRPAIIGPKLRPFAARRRRIDYCETLFVPRGRHQLCIGLFVVPRI